MHFISLGSDDLLLFLLLKATIKKLKKQVKRIRILINEKQLTDNLPRFFSDRFKERAETFQAFRSSHRFWGLSDAAILVWLKNEIDSLYLR
ncbi:hypothetical protein [Neochlamydia sp. S13]|uniref:hypothetical protein n=1 Tax=Neochlamydia sp. S13 TaxID=1353976 RepID=UPI0005A76E85|nr:hypothetical protein [Neochlamydia sp. S13]BBI18094.1 hypothetical protein NCS13_1_1899 [Neochlamydia sp. S13]